MVENQGRLYILLDVERIFGVKAKEIEEIPAGDMAPKIAEPKREEKKQTRDELDISFIGDTLAALAKFYVSPVNEKWVTDRYRSWRDMRPADEVQLASEADARQYLDGFYSPDTGTFWSQEYSNAFASLLPDNQAKQINVWNIGCGKGYEAYSLAVTLRDKYPNARVRIYANDSDLLAISNAPMLSVEEASVPPLYRPYMTKGVNGAWAFNQAIKDMILFEYHDCNNQNAVPNMDIIVSRDVISFLSLKQQSKMIAEMTDKLKDNGIIVLGRNEAMPQHSGWLRNVQGDIVSFSKE